MSDAADMKSKLLPFKPCMPRRLQANHLTGSSKVNVLDVEDFKAGIPYNPPEALLSSSGIDWEFQPHPNLYTLLGSQTLIHYKMYKADRADKRYTGTYFYLGGAGTGKSRHGTEFANSVREAIKKYSNYKVYEELKGRLEKACVFHVSFGNGSPFLSEEKSDPFNAIGIRMLAQLLRCSVGAVRRKYVADPQHIFQLVAAAKKEDYFDDFTGILVVDGIQNIGARAGDGRKNDSPLYELLVKIAALSRKPQRSSEFGRKTAPFILTCVTASCYGPIYDFVGYTSSLRTYLPLNRLNAPKWKGTQKPVIEPSDFTDLLVGDVGGHGRAMELLAELLDEYQSCPISEFADRLCLKVEQSYGDALKRLRQYAFTITQAILSRRRIQIVGRIPGSDLLWENVTMPGLIWFVSDGSEFGYLEAPYIWLWMMTRKLFDNEKDKRIDEQMDKGSSPEDDNAHLRQFLRDWKFNDYELLYGLVTGKGEPVTWQSFERFCCNFRAFRSLGFGDKEIVSLRLLHLGCNLRDDGKTMVVNRHLTFAEAKHQYRTDSIKGKNSASGKSRSAKRVKTKLSGDLDAESQLSHVILNDTSARAGDFFFSLETLEGRIVREVGQCKLLQDKFPAKEYDGERTKSAGKDDFFILYTSAEVSGNLDLPDRCGIVDDDCWDEYFGPFAGRAYLAARYGSKQAVQQSEARRDRVRQDGTRSVFPNLSWVIETPGSKAGFSTGQDETGPSETNTRPAKPASSRVGLVITEPPVRRSPRLALPRLCSSTM